MVVGCEKTGSIVQCLLKYWMKALDDCDGPEGCWRLRSVFAEGEDAIDVIDEASNFDEYEEKWEAATENIQSISFSLSGEPSVEVHDERVLINFMLIGEGVTVDGAELDPKPRWRGEHEWRQFDGEWRIVRERLTSL